MREIKYSECPIGGTSINIVIIILYLSTVNRLESHTNKKKCTYTNLFVFTSVSASRKIKKQMAVILARWLILWLLIKCNSCLLWFCFTTLCDWLANSRHFLNQWEAKPKPTVTCAHAFPALGAGYVYLLRGLIGSLHCLRLSWLGTIITPPFVLRHPIENRCYTRITNWNVKLFQVWKLGIYSVKVKQRRVLLCKGKCCLVLWKKYYGRKYALLTKREVKMAGYWPSSFFAFLWTETKSRSMKTQKKNEANIQSSWPNKLGQ